MKKTLLVGAIVLLSLSACVPSFLNTGAEEAPAEAVDIAATVDTEASTQAAQTLVALATPTLEPPTEEPTATATETTIPTETATATLTETPDGTIPAETATETPDGTETVLPAESETASLVATETGTPAATATSVYPSPTSPISVNMPPAGYPSYKIKIVNDTKYRVYISLHGATEDGYKPIIEYDLAPWQRVKLTIPEGHYNAIVYVGKDPMTGSFSVHTNNTVEIIINKDKLKINK